MASPLVVLEPGRIERPVCLRHLDVVAPVWVLTAIATRIGDEFPCVVCDAVGPDACDHSRAAASGDALRAFARAVLEHGHCRECPPPWAR